VSESSCWLSSSIAVTFGKISPFSPAPAREVVGAVEAIGDIEYYPVFKEGPEGSFMMTGHLAKDPCQVDPVRKFSTFVDDGLDLLPCTVRIHLADLMVYLPRAPRYLLTTNGYHEHVDNTSNFKRRHSFCLCLSSWQIASRVSIDRGSPIKRHSSALSPSSHHLGGGVLRRAGHRVPVVVETLPLRPHGVVVALPDLPEVAAAAPPVRLDALGRCVSGRVSGGCPQPPATSGQAPSDKSGVTVGSLNQVGVKLFRSAVVRGCMDDVQVRVQLEFEGVEAKGQSFPN
jgi:hypothetical protein